ncbi:permease prefix domain 1-containing protein [Aliidiomarina celeris]|uniref:permease prefix domain 1-containing protein n=1 Tax=Aliidiomarina celeris TaxID=2249428 RepID=UPI0018E649BC|nr:permease prefix domain 1-containing protein [Aliidiomarina celeris]
MNSNPPNPFHLTESLHQWRSQLARNPALKSEDLDELEDHLQSHIEALTAAGLKADEAFLIACKRVGEVNNLSEQYAEVHSGRLWHNLFQASETHRNPLDLIVVLVLAVAAAALFKLPDLLGFAPVESDTEFFYIRNISLFCIPMLGFYFVYKRELGRAGFVVWAASVVALALVLNLYPFQAIENSHSTLLLAALHVPIVLWFLVGVLYTGDYWQSTAKQMNFIRFSGEFVIYYVLIALGGAVVALFTLGMFSFIGIHVEWFVQLWLIPCGAMGAVVVAGWLVEAKQSAIENMAPVLTRLFTPMFAALLLVFLITMLVTGRNFDIQRELLIGLDLMLVLVLGLVLYAVSSREPAAPVNYFDKLLLLLIVSALAVNILALGAMIGRISHMGFTPNRVAALGENIVLLVSLTGYAWLYGQFLRRRIGFHSIERWQTGYVPVYAAWALIVVAVFPLVFGFA